jgi:hypothetical protein
MLCKEKLKNTVFCSLDLLTPSGEGIAVNSEKWVV